MEEVTAHFDILDTLRTLRGQRSVHFCNKANRDTVFKLAKAEGLNIKKSSIKNQQLHPEYLEDYKGTYNTGFGNTDYQMFWANLYNIEVAR